jgi:hypothetical protein
LNCTHRCSSTARAALAIGAVVVVVDVRARGPQRQRAEVDAGHAGPGDRASPVSSLAAFPDRLHDASARATPLSQSPRPSAHAPADAECPPARRRPRPRHAAAADGLASRDVAQRVDSRSGPPVSPPCGNPRTNGERHASRPKSGCCAKKSGARRRGSSTTSWRFPRPPRFGRSCTLSRLLKKWTT